MRLKEKCLLCFGSINKEISLREGIQNIIGFNKLNVCETCQKALLQIGLTRFSDVKLEMEEQQKKWVVHRDKILKDKSQ